MYIATSLDGFIARPNGEVDWLGEPPQDGGEDYGCQKFMDTVDFLVMGRSQAQPPVLFLAPGQVRQASGLRAALARMYDRAARALSCMTSPNWPVRVSCPFPRIRRTSVANNSPPTWSSASALTDTAIDTDEFFVKTTTTIALSSLNLTAGSPGLIECTRDATDAGDTLVGDSALVSYLVEFS